MPFYNATESQAEAEKDLMDCHGDWKLLISGYVESMNRILISFGGSESNIPLTDRYYIIRNKRQYIAAKYQQG